MGAGKRLMELAPIALFAYNRPVHTRRTLESLQKNELASQSDLYAFADGAKNAASTAAVQEVREFVRGIEGFKSVTVIERERNVGLANSVITGVTQLCADLGRVIAVEDDLLTAPDFLAFMNQALQRYAGEPRIFSVSGFNFPVAVPNSYAYDAYCSFRSISWGWGTWKDRWQRADWSVRDFAEFIADREQQKRFNQGGDDLTRMLALQMAGRIDSWSIRWDYTHFKHNALAVLPVCSRVYNIGFDASGVHCRRARFRQSPLKNRTRCEYRFPEAVEADPHFTTEIQRLHRISFARMLGHYFKDRMEWR